MKKWRIAIVVQRYGEEVNGGAELHARWLAEQLLSLAEVDVITTCSLDYMTWANHYQPGVSRLHGVHVHRFPVDAPRDWNRFKKLTGRFFDRRPTVIEQLEWVSAQGPMSTPLLEYIDDHHDDYDAFIFFTYLYATTFFGLPLVPDRAILVPTAHDEPPLYLPIFRSLFHLPCALAYNTASEKALVNRVTRNSGGCQQEVLAGVGINVPAEAAPAAFRRRHQIEGDFLLYVGRIDESKNVPQLFDLCRRYRKERPAPLQLVLIGKANIPIPDEPYIRYLGFVSEQEKFDAISAATLVVVPSQFESLSMIALEAWLMEKAVLVNGRCDVLKEQCRLSNGGLYYTSYEEFAEALSLLLASPRLRARLGRQGKAFAEKRYSANVIVQKYEQILNSLPSCR